MEQTGRTITIHLTDAGDVDNIMIEHRGHEREMDVHVFDEEKFYGQSLRTFLDGLNVRTGYQCFRCGSPLFDSEIDGYDKQCFVCDEDFYLVECVEVEQNDNMFIPDGVE